MGYMIAFLVGAIIAGMGVFIMIAEQRRSLAAQRSKQEVQAKTINETIDKLDRGKQILRNHSAALKQDQDDFQRRIVAYDDLQHENEILKVDLRNVDVERRKLKLDRDMQGERQDELDRKTNELAGRYLKENVNWISASAVSN